MFTVTGHETKASHLYKLLGLTIEFEEVRWVTGGLELVYNGSAVAMLTGELLEAFQSHQYVWDQEFKY